MLRVPTLPEHNVIVHAFGRRWVSSSVTEQTRAAREAAARAEVERVLQEQQAWHKKALAQLKRQEAEAGDVLRRREKEIESQGFEHRQRMLGELGALRTREKQLQAEAEAAKKELAAQTERLSAQQSLSHQQLAANERVREVELRRMEDELLRVQREQQQELQQRMAEVSQQAAALRQREVVLEKERERHAILVSRAAMTREQLAEAREAGARKDEQLVTLHTEVRALRAREPARSEEKMQLQARLAEAEEALRGANARSASLSQQLADAEQTANTRLHESRVLLEQSAAALKHRTRELADEQAEHAAALKKAREQTRHVAEEQQRSVESHHQKYATELRRARAAAAEAQAKAAALERHLEEEKAGGAKLREEVDAVRTPTDAALAGHFAPRLAPSHEAAARNATMPGEGPPAMRVPAGSAAPFGLDEGYASGDPFASAFEESAAKRMEELTYNTVPKPVAQLVSPLTPSLAHSSARSARPKRAPARARGACMNDGARLCAAVRHHGGRY